jgi:hypothetical protein
MANCLMKVERRSRTLRMVADVCASPVGDPL